MAELPAGTVTFLFTDSEGSTQLVKRFGDHYAEVLAEHQRLIREAAEERGGRKIDTQGDSFRLMKRALALQSRDPSAANALWARIDRLLTDRAPFVHLLVGQLPYFVSGRVGNYQYHPVHELLLDQLWVR